MYLIVSLDSTTTNELGARYVVKVEHQAAANRDQAPSLRALCFGGRQGERRVCAARSQGADPENPDALVLKLVDTGEVVTIRKDKPFRRVDGYRRIFVMIRREKSFTANASVINFPLAEWITWWLKSTRTN